jgi:hypothetical protein
MLWNVTCSLCEHVPLTLEQTCFAQCRTKCGEALSANACDDLASCTWCKSQDQLHQLCFFKALSPESGWVCDGSDASAGVRFGKTASPPVIHV